MSKKFVLWLMLIGTALSCSKEQRRDSSSENHDRQGRPGVEEIEAGIRAYISKKSKEEGGSFRISDRGRDFQMKLVRVHTEYLSNVGEKKYFACVDLADENGDVYDVDFFLEGEPGAMEVTETSVHKLNGKPYYAWKQGDDKTWQRVAVSEASTRLLGVIEGEDDFEFYYDVQLPEIQRFGEMWIPLATSDPYQTVEILKMDVPGKHKVLRDHVNDNSVLYVQLSSTHSLDEISIHYRVWRREKSPASGDDVLPIYLQSDSLTPVGGRFFEIATKATKGVDGNLMRARALYDYVVDNMRYRKNGMYGKGDANYACDQLSGNCTEFHSFFISLARSVGIPSRFAVGAAIPSERNEGGVEGYHCWAEFYAEGKWWPVDISEGNKYSPLATYYFGHHPANRVEFTRGRDIKLEPGPESGPINFLVYPILELEGKEVPVKTRFSFQRRLPQSL